MESQLSDKKQILDITENWSTELLLNTIKDYWPAFYLDALFSWLEETDQFSIPARENAIQGLSEKLTAFFDKLPLITSTQSRLVEDISELLNLPVWKHRYELYSAWILTTITQAMKAYPLEVHHNDGTLTLSFKATHVATIKNKIGSMQLWSEVRSPLENPVGKTRKTGMQPDYAIYDAILSPEDCIVAVEVKQYRKGGTRNFSHALEDYSKGLKNAHVIVVNYGKISNALALPYPERNSAFGEVFPGSLGLRLYLDALKKCLPALPAPEFFSHLPDAILHNLIISDLFIDISASLDTLEYKSFLREFLTPLVQAGMIERINAVDVSLRAFWDSPSEKSVEELIGLSFSYNTDFMHLLPKEQSGIFIITDDDGAVDLTEFDNPRYTLLLFSNSGWTISNIIQE
ncbi:hypothetical protein [uncultured Pedobacter sp.]|uniref:hypothetical protein n=1 Tax=uncultured Pedobacter sp. TaxID=246139 RepID=UPI0025DBCDCF|nr:hypothetical protein [uncultured Pedobacter sp.]